MKTVAVCSGKGGAGKTVVCSALGTMLSQLGKRVLLIDADYAVAGLSILSSKAPTVIKLQRITFRDILSADDARRVAELVTTLAKGEGLPEVPWAEPSIKSERLFVIESRRENFTGLNTTSKYPFNKTIRNYHAFLDALRTSEFFHYVIADCRAGLDEVSAAIALCSERVLVIMEQDRVSWASSTEFVTKVLALRSVENIHLDEETSEERYRIEASPEQFILIPNKVTYGFARGLMYIGGELPGGIHGSIPLDLNFFQRYFRDIARFSPKGMGWTRTGFYRYLRATMERVFPELEELPVSYISRLLEIKDTMVTFLSQPPYFVFPLLAVMVVMAAYLVAFVFFVVK